LKTLIKVLLISILSFSFSFGDEKEDLKKHFLEKVDELITVIKDKESSKDQRNEKIRVVIDPMFDFELMAKLSLGKKWLTLNEEESKEFVKLYVERMKNSYSSKFDTYKDEKVKILEILSPKSNRLVLVTDLVTNGDKLSIVYKFYKPKTEKQNKDRWLIYDVEIQGVSMLKTDKSQFSEFLQTKTIQELMDSMAKTAEDA
jgi:phospholipid transport system substrate-binding protein